MRGGAPADGSGAGSAGEPRAVAPVVDGAAVRWAATPGAPPGPTAPLLVLLHGYGSHEGDLLGLAPHLPGGLALAAPRGPLTGGPGFAWAPVATPGRPEPERVRDGATALLAWLDGDPRAARRPVALLGFSQGGLMVTQLLRTRPDRFAAAVVLSGFALDAEEPGDALLAARDPRVPVLLGHGDADPVIPRAATTRTAAWLAEHADPEEHAYPGLAHGIDARVLADVSAFLARTLPLG
ncbi:dienelactone hydrolase family protein [Cellulomonas sp. IC4_254]|uniref:dienelactone hydrolase family protein n=1 Tax=Cellulomonas sp. IC4_254 TaxID=2714040 RepID=UPI00141F8E33|nr:phospholipase [Cellulomonas sp. IC4_254]